ncbi:cohesin domain-containing protein, partial [bacterium]|nr:cohesin domain-containing protein [bacterium]
MKNILISRRQKNIFLIFAMFFVFFAFSKISFAAIFNLTADKDLYKIGDQVEVNIKIDSEDTGINVAQVTLKYDPSLLEVKSLDRKDSVFSFWLSEPEYSNTDGTIDFIGGSTSGFTGKSLQVLKVLFKVKGTGTANLTFTDGAISAADGSGTNVLTTMNGLEIKSLSKSEIIKTGPTQIEREAEVAPNAPAKPVLNISLYPEPKDWYSQTSDFSVKWDLPRDITGVATILNKIPTSQPSVSEGLFDNKIFKAIDDGVWYLHVRFKNNIGWGVTNHYRIAIDTVPPLPFEVRILESVSPDNPTPTIKYESKDQFSGISEYTIVVDDVPKDSTEKAEYTLQNLKPGLHLIKIVARDKAGNATESKMNVEILPITSPIILFVNNDVFIGEDGLVLNGTSLPNADILIDLNSSAGETIFQGEIKSDQAGLWSFNISEPLKKGNYYAEVTARDDRGALSFPVRTDKITVQERPIMTVFGLKITYTYFIWSLLVLIVVIFIIGFLTRKLMGEKRQRRILIAERDVNAQLMNIQKDVENLIEKHKKGDGDCVDENIENEVDFTLKKI